MFRIRVRPRVIVKARITVSVRVTVSVRIIVIVMVRVRIRFGSFFRSFISDVTQNKSFRKNHISEYSMI